jgi:hypothetical protein
MHATDGQDDARGAVLVPQPHDLSVFCPPKPASDVRSPERGTLPPPTTRLGWPPHPHSNPSTIPAFLLHTTRIAHISDSVSSG